MIRLSKVSLKTDVIIWMSAFFGTSVCFNFAEARIPCVLTKVMENHAKNISALR